MELDLGTRLNGRYSIKRVIGQGNMSYVYEAFDDLLQRPVAIKQMVIPHGAWDSASFIKRFRREFHFLSAIEHPNVIKAYGFFSEANTAFMVLEIVKGPSLQDLIVKRAQMHVSLSMNLAIAIQLSRAIEVINTAGIIHRDIKPTNVIINDVNKKLKLLDLGVATTVKSELSRLTNHGHIVGTPDYLSPEQINGEYASNSDVFSVAVVLYQIFAGDDKSPFHNENPMSTMMSISTKELPSLLDISNLSSELYRQTYVKIWAVLEKALIKEPEERMSSATEMADEFEMIYKGYRLAKSRVKEKKSQVVNWNVIEKTKPEEFQKLKKLGDKFGRDDTPLRKRRRRTKSKRTPRYQAEKKSTPVVGFLVMAVFVLATALFLFIHFAETEKIPPKKSIAQQKSEMFERLLLQIKTLKTPDKWSRVNNFNLEHSFAKSLAKKEQLERDIFETLINANAFMNSNNSPSTKQLKKWEDIYFWKQNIAFLELYRNESKIKQQFELFEKHFSDVEKNKINSYTLENKIGVEVYRKRNLKNVREILNAMSNVSDLQKKIIKQYHEEIDTLENVLVAFKRKMRSLRGKDVKVVVGKKWLKVKVLEVEDNYISIKKGSKTSKFYLYNLDGEMRQLDARNFAYHVRPKLAKQIYCYALLFYYGKNYKTAYKYLLRCVNYSQATYFLHRTYRKIYSQPLFKMDVLKPQKIEDEDVLNVTTNRDTISLRGKILINKNVTTKAKKDIISGITINVNGKKARRRNNEFALSFPVEYGKNFIDVKLSIHSDKEILRKSFYVERDFPRTRNFSNTNFFPSLSGEFQVLNWQNHYGKNLGIPVVLKQHVYVKDHSNILYKTTINGEMVWKKDNVSALTYDEIKTSTKNIYEYFLYISSPDQLVCYDESNMQPLWEKSLSDVIYPGIILKNYIVFATATTLHAINYKTQKQLWQKTIAPATKAILANNSAYFAMQNGEVISYRIKDGKKRIALATGSPISSAPTTSGHTIFVGNHQGNFYAFFQGKKLWKYSSSASIRYSPAFDGDYVYFVNDDNKLYCCDARLGNSLWVYQAQEKIICQPLVAKDKIFLCTQPGKILSIDRSTGQKTWQYATQNTISHSAPTIEGKTMYIGDDGGNLYSLKFD
ncbi:serine/threonine-protein kinase [Candidatus Uabimicrobium amorphum]|uniref:Protein kinase n=1 Tax=Uabimicrobium amorphum TaxID=2596890 RepID=A0A5S9IIJ3_UABAM|nr:serine/threonine-protein kinase [Candidatus Uabimicrobium amorphum]BBM82191.1 protein kinase [Candidatus Uabimicrobium amorphum]